MLRSGSRTHRLAPAPTTRSNRMGTAIRSAPVGSQGQPPRGGWPFPVADEEGASAMRTSQLIRVLAVIAATLALAAVTTTSGLASVNGCPAGRVGLAVQWADAQVSYACAPASDATSVEIVGLLVRQSDGSVRTIDLAASQSSVVSSSSTSSSISSSTSTTCINGQCTTTSDKSVCVDGSCSD
jgi:hypothetical protein